MIKQSFHITRISSEITITKILGSLFLFVLLASFLTSLEILKVFKSISTKSTFASNINTIAEATKEFAVVHK